MEGGLISKRDREFSIGSEFNDIAGVLFFLRGRGERAPDLGVGVWALSGDSARGEGGGRRGLFGRSGRPGSGFFGGSIGEETLFNERRVSFFRKSVNSKRLPVA